MIKNLRRLQYVSILNRYVYLIYVSSLDRRKIRDGFIKPKQSNICYREAMLAAIVTSAHQTAFIHITISTESIRAYENE